MSLYRWWRMRQARRRRSLIKRLRVANQALQLAYQGMKANQNYHPTCMGAAEDKYAGERQWQVQINYWYYEVRRLAHKLKVTPEQVAKYR